MKVAQHRWTPEAGWVSGSGDADVAGAQVVLVFGGTESLRESRPFEDLKRLYPDALLFGCSTAGEIAGERIFDDSIVATALRFEHTTVRAASTRIAADADGEQAGRSLAEQLLRPDLSHLFVLSDGLKVNGTHLVKGLTQGVPASVTITGGLAGDGTRFSETLVVCNGPASAGTVAAIGFYGSRLRIACAAFGGWDPFGPERLITRSAGSVLYELDGQSALSLYKRYLGEDARDLPASALLFPLSVRVDEHDEPSVRTILGVDEATQSMTFAGDMPTGGRARLMKANFDRLIDGAYNAARANHLSIGTPVTELAILISCVGRRLVLKQRTEEEVEAVREVLGDVPMAGFYSYGEIGPFRADTRCRLHNQTMTVTTLSEHEIDGPAPVA